MTFFLEMNYFLRMKCLNSVIEKIGQEIKDCEVSFYLHRKSMGICCETTTMTHVLARKLLKLVYQLMDEHFFQTNGLRELGWCSNYMLDRRSLNYYKDKQVFVKVK